MDREYLPISGAIFFILGLIWRRDDFKNLAFKLALLFMFAWAGIQYVRGQ